MSLPPISIDVDLNYIPVEFRSELGEILQSVLRKVIAKMIRFLTQVVPQDTGRLLKSSINVLKQSFTTNSFISIQYGFPVKYSRYVNEMENVNWTTPGTHGKFYQAGLVYLRKTLIDELNKELANISIDRERQKKFEDLLKLLLAFQSNKQLAESLVIE